VTTTATVEARAGPAIRRSPRAATARALGRVGGSHATSMKRRPVSYARDRLRLSQAWAPANTSPKVMGGLAAAAPNPAGL